MLWMPRPRSSHLEATNWCPWRLAPSGSRIDVGTIEERVEAETDLHGSRSRHWPSPLLVGSAEMSVMITLSNDSSHGVDEALLIGAAFLTTVLTALTLWMAKHDQPLPGYDRDQCGHPRHGAHRGLRGYQFHLDGIAERIARTGWISLSPDRESRGLKAGRRESSVVTASHFSIVEMSLTGPITPRRPPTGVQNRVKGNCHVRGKRTPTRAPPGNRPRAATLSHGSQSPSR